MAKILLVEDDPNIRMAAEFALSDAGILSLLATMELIGLQVL